MNRVPIFQVDAFTSKPFAGNPAAVCLPESAPDELWMKQLAAEMNLSETAFAYPDNGQLRLRWLTPMVEVDLCGHATLATAHILKELSQRNELPAHLQPFWKSGTVQFISRSGTLTAETTADGITLDFPAGSITPTEPASGLLQALGVTTDQVEFCGRTPFDVFIRLQTAVDVRSLSPAMSALAKCDARGVIVTALGDTADHDVISRFFAPASGIDEDPVTGSAHCSLATYWAPEFGRSTLFGFQASARGGHVKMELQGDRVRLSGQAVTILQGFLDC